MDPKDDNATNPVPRDPTSAQGNQASPDASPDSSSLGTGTGDFASTPTPDTNTSNEMPSLASEEPGGSGVGGDAMGNPGGFVSSNPPSTPDAPDVPPLDTTPPAAGGVTPPDGAETPLSPIPNQPFEPSGPAPANNPGAVPPQPLPSDIPPTAPAPVPASAGDKKTFLLLLVVAVVLIGVAAFLLLG